MTGGFAVRLLNFLVEAFIAGFGITRPSEEKRRQVTLILGGFFVVVILFLLGISGYFWYSLQR